MTVSEVSDAYGARAAEYINLFGGIDAAAEADRDAVLAWARGLTGPVIDVGCGPGQWTHFLFENDLEIEGIDPTPEFIDAVTTAYYWPLELLSARVEACGFTVTRTARRTDPGVRTQGFITAALKSQQRY